jgi:glutaredoxin 3
LTAVAEVRIYTTPRCGYCKRAKALFAAKAIDYVEIDVSRDPEAFDELSALTDQRSFPQILIDGDAIGGWAQLSELEASGKLDGLLS